MARSRRDVLLGMAGLSAGSIATGCAPAGDPQTVPSAVSPPPPLRFAHLTDMHVDADPRRRGDLGFAAALRHLSAIVPAPAFILTGGDHVFDAFAGSRGWAERQWDAYDAVHAAGTRLPVRPLIGNHDVWGWADPDLSPATPGYGKSMACARLDLASPYYSFDAGGWHFVMLDNVARRGRSYYGALDDEQAEWLKSDLKSAGGRPVCVASHIPLLAACAFFDVDVRFKDDAWHVPDAVMHRDPGPLIDLLKTADTRLCVSGHVHLVDRVEYRGITFVCGGAVCGNWWKGPMQGVPEGYSLFDLHADGRFEHQYVAYGWRKVGMKAEG